MSRMTLPMVGCRRITLHSEPSRLDGLRRIASGTAILPTSCMRLACMMTSTSPGGSFIPRAITGAVLAHPLDVPGGDLVLVLGDNRQPLDRIELREVRQALCFGHFIERLAQAGRPLLDHLFEARLVGFQPVLRLLHLQQRRRTDAELGRVDGLRDEIVGSGLDRAQSILPAHHGGDHDHGDVAAARILTDAATDLEAIQARHHDVEQHQIDAELKFGEPFDAVARRLGVVPQRLDQHLRDLPRDIIVVYDEDAAALVGWRMTHAKNPDRTFLIRLRNARSADHDALNRLETAVQFCHDRFTSIERSAARRTGELGAAARHRTRRPPSPRCPARYAPPGTRVSPSRRAIASRKEARRVDVSRRNISITWAASPGDPLASRPRRCSSTSTPMGSGGVATRRSPAGPQTLQAVSAELDQLLGAQVRRKLFGELERVPVPVANHVLILVTGALDVAVDHDRGSPARNAPGRASRPGTARGAATRAPRQAARGGPQSCPGAGGRAASRSFRRSTRSACSRPPGIGHDARRRRRAAGTPARSVGLD